MSSRSLPRGTGETPVLPGSAALYIHIPWCRSICSYCDFDRQAHGFELIPAYVQSLVVEITRQPPLALHSIFFGGGTPSLLEPEQVETILSACRERFELLPAAEVTVEANPGDLNADRVAAYLAAGVNRVSMGVQSLDDAMLRLLHRRHTASEAEDAVAGARRGGCANLSLDLMYGLPGQSVAHWRKTLARALALRPEHVSAYLLTIDERVPLGRQVSRGAVTLPIDDDIAEMYAHTQRSMLDAGYEQYEISNWALPGRASRHNLTYWRDEPYIGIGAGAASSFKGRRYKNTTDPAAYIMAIESGGRDLVEDELIDELTAAQDFVALGLRLREGLNLEVFRRRFGRDLLDLARNEINDLADHGIVELQRDRLGIASEHLLVSNEIILRLHESLARAWTADVRLQPA